MEKEDSIDLGRLWQILLERKKVVGGIILSCTLLATVIAFILPKQYESTTLVQTRSAGKDIGGAAAMRGHGCKPWRQQQYCFADQLYRTHEEPPRP